MPNEKIKGTKQHLDTLSVVIIWLLCKGYHFLKNEIVKKAYTIHSVFPMMPVSWNCSWNCDKLIDYYDSSESGYVGCIELALIFFQYFYFITPTSANCTEKVNSNEVSLDNPKSL